MLDLRTRLKSLLLVAVAGSGLILIGLSAAEALSTRVERTIIYSASVPERTVGELAAASDAVVILHSTGRAVVNWNSSDHRAWSSTDREHPAYIYRDETVVIDSVLRGSVPTGELTLRKLGGTADRVQMIFEDDPMLSIGERYLVFLTFYPTPTDGDPEPRWTIQWQAAGVFQNEGGTTWVNSAYEMSLTEEALASIP